MAWLDYGGVGSAIGPGSHGEATPSTSETPVQDQLTADTWEAWTVEDPSYDRPGFLDQTPPVIAINSTSVTRVSTVTGHDIDIVQFQTNKDFQQWRIEQVASGSSVVFSGTLLASGGVGTANTPVNASVTGEAMQTAGDLDGAYTIKVFAQDYAGNWST